MLIKGIAHLLIWLLFISRIIPKYLIFRGTNQVQLLGHSWEGGSAVLILLIATTIAIIVLAIAIKSIYQYFTMDQNKVDT